VSEASLIASARQGDEAAWEALVRQYQEAVFRLAYLLLGDADEAEDVAQEAFIRAFRALDRFDTTRPLRPWLLQITANLARNERRAMGRYLGALTRLIWTDSKPMSSTEDQSIEHLESQRLWQVVQRLNSADQEVIYLRFFLELPEAEMAAALQVAPGTIKSRLHRALSRLRTIVESDLPMLQGERGR
jgi:RNA polymerase sigma-70 factor (ECF subfamily)